eukprot:COSAG02_NODE_188_length_30307_cov_341.858746_20_plen_122_part_00
MDGRAGAVALNVRHMLSPPRGSSPAPVVEDESDGCHVTLTSTPRPNAISIDSTRGTSSAASKEQLRERLVMAEARVAAAASSTARAQHMAAHLRDMLSPQATHTNSRLPSPFDTRSSGETC